MDSRLPSWDNEAFIDTTWGELVELKYGKALKGYKEAIGEFPVYGTNGAVGFCNKPLCDYPSVIIGRKGAYRGVHFSKKPFFVIDTAFYISPKYNINLKWAYYFLLTQDINGLDSGSAIPSTRREDFYALPARVPPRKIQDSIVAQLDSLEEKINLNRHNNQTLESIAQAIFKSWFVDFDPVKAKITALESGGSKEDTELAAMGVIASKTTEELAELKQTHPDNYQQLAETAALFPSAMQVSELGEIPEGWNIYSLSSLINLTGGGTPKRSIAEYWNGDIPWFSVRDVPAAGNVFVICTEETITELGLKKSSTKLLPKGTTIITARGTVGKLALVAEDMCMNQSCYGVNGKEFGPYFNYFFLSQAVSTLKQNTHGAVFDTITTSTFDTYRSSYCGATLASRFEISVAPLLSKIENNLRENMHLDKIKNLLLPKLLSGEFDLQSLDAVETTV